MTTPASKPLTPAQREHLSTLAQQIGLAETELDAATRLRDVAQGNANGFLAYCARELGVPLGTDGWTWIQDQFSFVQMPPKEGTSTENEKKKGDS